MVGSNQSFRRPCCRSCKMTSQEAAIWIITLKMSILALFSTVHITKCIHNKLSQ